MPLVSTRLFFDSQQRFYIHRIFLVRLSLIELIRFHQMNDSGQTGISSLQFEPIKWRITRICNQFTRNNLWTTRDRLYQTGFRSSTSNNTWVSIFSTLTVSVPSRTLGHDILLRASASTLLWPDLY